LEADILVIEDNHNSRAKENSYDLEMENNGITVMSFEETYEDL
jgi:hypothetical protein